jgi:hypothetical protein
MGSNSGAAVGSGAVVAGTAVGCAAGCVGCGAAVGVAAGWQAANNTPITTSNDTSENHLRL